MSRTTKKICLFVAVFLLLEIALLVGWNYVKSQRDTIGHMMQAQTIPSEAVPETTAAETHPAETEPVQTTAEETAIPETEPEVTVPATTGPGETEPEATAAEETLPEETLPPETEPVVLTMDQVPQYFQTDYPDARYGTTNIATGGSSVTALAMVASYMTDHTYYPDEVADYVAHFIGNHYERLEFGSDLLQLSWKRAKNIHEVLQAVKDGKVAIVLMNGKSVFTSTHHYIVLTGVNEEGKITLLDPDKNHYSRQGIDAYLKDGIKEGYLFAGFEGGWIYDKSAMPEEPVIYIPEPFAEECRYSDVQLTEAELNLLADLIWMEGQSEPFEGQQAIAEVVLNRLVSGDFGTSVSAIIRAPHQFESVPYLYKAEPTYTQYKAIERAMYGPYVLPIDVVFYAKFAVNKDVWGKIGAHTFCYGY